MVKWFSIFSVFFISANCFAIENYKVGDSLTVFINSGLKLREKPTCESETLATISVGKKVFIKKQLLREHKHQDSFASIRLIKGHWVKVDFEGKTGYVFDGYLSTLPHPTNFKNSSFAKNGYSTEANYLFAHFDTIGGAFDTTLIPKEYGNYYQNSTPYNRYKEYSLKFSNGIIYTKVEHLEIGSTNKIKFENHSLDEVLLLAKAIIDIYDGGYTTNKFIKDDSNNYMMGAVYEAGCSIGIHEKDGVIYWSQYCGC